MASSTLPNPQSASQILTINGGSSSIKFAVFGGMEPPIRTLMGTIDRIGLNETTFKFHDSLKDQRGGRTIDAACFGAATDFLVRWLDDQVGLPSIAAVGHRVVHGMQHTAPQRVTQDLLDHLRSIIACDPQHLPGEIELIEGFRKRYPNLTQVACFDTLFHAAMPRVAKMLAIPRRLSDKGVHRYGFHGLSFAYLLQELARLGDAAATNGRVILAHLGNGSSLAAVRDGKSIDTSMGFTPAAGLPMGSRSGDLDPGLIGYLARSEQMTPDQFDQMVNHESGLLGVSELSSDVRDLLAMEKDDIRAAEAIALFCYQTKKWIGAFAAALGGLDTLVFAGGIGENSPAIRSGICDGLQFLGIAIDENRNEADGNLISTPGSSVAVRVVRTDEELMIARQVRDILVKEVHALP
jgi:acetate kinase